MQGETMATAMRLADEAEIRALIGAYAEAVGDGAAERAAATYAENGHLIAFGQTHVGRAALAEVLRSVAERFSLARQTPHATLVELHGDRAPARSAILEIGQAAGSAALFVYLGAYEDELVRLAVGWRFAKRTFHVAGRLMLEAG
jgi:hypothetical protein